MAHMENVGRVVGYESNGKQNFFTTDSNIGISLLWPAFNDMLYILNTLNCLLL